MLDNFEHLVTAAPEVSNLLDSCRRLKILVTSRVALRVSGEQQFPVPPLSLPDLNAPPSGDSALQSDAVRLFLQRARAVRGDFQPSANEVTVIAKICQRLDGLPLAIELAAARVSHLSPVAMLARLEQSTSPLLSLLTGGARNHPARFQSLRDTIAWSYDLLDEAEQALFQDLSVFPASFSLAGAEYVGGEGGAATHLHARRPRPHSSPRTSSATRAIPAMSPATQCWRRSGSLAANSSRRTGGKHRRSNDTANGRSRLRNAPGLERRSQTRPSGWMPWSASSPRCALPWTGLPNEEMESGWPSWLQPSGRSGKSMPTTTKGASGWRRLWTWAASTAPHDRLRLLTGAGTMARHQADFSHGKCATNRR